MSETEATVEYITPTEAELQPFHKIRCKEAECAAIFTNAGNYELHLKRHHKLTSQRREDGPLIRLYYCPDAECVYSLKRGPDGRHFKHLKNLRQHFQKIHFKKFKCDHCERTFPTQGQLKTHANSVCGKKFQCGTCNWEFETKSAMILHGKRKGHVTQDVNEAVSPEKQNSNKQTLFTKDSHSKDIECLERGKEIEAVHSQHKDTQTYTIQSCSDSSTNASALYECHDSQTQTVPFLDWIGLDGLDAIYQDTETQTDITAFLDHFAHHDIQTQTELSLQNHSQRHTSPLSNSNSSGGFLDQMLSQTSLAHMHTQTCDDYLLSELGLTDIQTQTNWSSFNESTNATTTTSTSTAGFAHDELLVSTETQTSFTQCLLDSTDGSGHITTDNAATCTADGTMGEESNTSNYVNLYNTQQTQTCDFLLENLFGGQENDLIAGFQSTYTQT